jgi:hypothetical protein
MVGGGVPARTRGGVFVLILFDALAWRAHKHAPRSVGVVGVVGLRKWFSVGS